MGGPCVVPGLFPCRPDLYRAWLCRCGCPTRGVRRQKWRQQRLNGETAKWATAKQQNRAPAKESKPAPLNSPTANESPYLDRILVNELVGGDLQIGGRGALANPAGIVIVGTMARAEVAAVIPTGGRNAT